MFFPRAHRQDPALTSLARIPYRPPNHDHRDQTAGSRLPKCVRCHRLICGTIFAKSEETTKEESTAQEGVFDARHHLPETAEKC